MHDIGIIFNYLIVSNFDGETFHTDGFDDLLAICQVIVEMQFHSYLCFISFKCNYFSRYHTVLT